MRHAERGARDAEFPTRYCLDEARFRGGRETLRNEEDEHEPTTHLA